MKDNLLRKSLSMAAAAALSAGMAVPVLASNDEGERGSACDTLEANGFLTSSDYHIEEVQPLKRVRRVGKATLQQTIGAQVRVRPTEGLNQHYLQRVAKCEVGQELNEVADGEVPAFKATVRDWYDRLMVDIVAEDLDQGREVETLVRRAVEQRAGGGALLLIYPQ